MAERAFFWHPWGTGHMMVKGPGGFICTMPFVSWRHAEDICDVLTELREREGAARALEFGRTCQAVKHG